MHGIKMVKSKIYDIIFCRELIFYQDIIFETSFVDLLMFSAINRPAICFAGI